MPTIKVTKRQAKLLRRVISDSLMKTKGDSDSSEKLDKAKKNLEADLAKGPVQGVEGEAQVKSGKWKSKKSRKKRPIQLN